MAGASSLASPTPASTSASSVTGHLPALRFSASDLSAGEGFEAWRQIMARMFRIDRSGVSGGLPSGGLAAILLGDVMGNRSTFNAQHLTRDRRRIGATPDHLVFQLYRSGGFVGEMGGRPIRISRGQIAICDLRQPLDVQAMTSDTIGLTVPRHLLACLDLDRLPARLDPDARPDLLDATEFDADILTLADAIIARSLASTDLSPEVIAERLQVSRATLYRVFAPLGGVMQRVWTLRLEAVRAALDAVPGSRTLTRLEADHGFKTAAHLSRSFRAHYGTTPREWRAQQADRSREDWQAGSARLNEAWRRLGR